MLPLTIGVSIETRQLREEAEASLRDLPVRIVLDEQETRAMLAAVESIHPDVLLIDICRMAAFDDVELDKGTRWETKYARQNGIHVSPTFAINGMVEPNMGSGQTVEEWVGLLQPHLAAA